MTYEDLKKKLTDIYEPEKNFIIERVTVRNRKQKPNETIQEYVIIFKKLAQKFKFTKTVLENNIKDQLIMGVFSKMMKYELLKQPSDTTLNKLIEMAKMVEIVSQQETGSPAPNDSIQTETEFHNIRKSGKFRYTSSEGNQAKRGSPSYT